ncbi:HNH endonuclease [Aeromonas sobria]|uniref:HNH endonuclease n=1 Tax=Aeromonas sobria TaxID=646 RepID=UPI0011DFBA87|nr:HNH endonuclease [Aeromonas sobria]
MRPVLRPNYNGTLYAQYGGYLKPLIGSFGQNCSYCERIDKLDIEHVIPKSCPAGKSLIVDWSNLLLGCPRCNRDFKRANNTTRTGYLWPDTDNTFSCLDYKPDGRVLVKNGLSAKLSYQAKKTLDLLQLDDSSHVQPALCIYRKGQFCIAEKFKENYLAGHQTINEIVDASKFAWSVWMTVFADQPQVITALVQSSILGTNQNYPYP